MYESIKLKKTKNSQEKRKLQDERALQPVGQP